MAKAKSLNTIIGNSEYNLAKYRFVLEKFPDAEVRNEYWAYQEFNSKTVNANYTNFDFEHGWSSLYVIPYYKLEFSYNDNKELIKVHSNPKRKKLAYRSYQRINGKRVIRFNKVAFNLKADNFKDDMLNACRAEIMTFIQKYPDHHLDDKHLEPRLKKLLLFT